MRRDHPAGASIRDRFDVLDLDQIAAQVLDSERVAPTPHSTSAPTADGEEESPLTSETTASAMHSALAALAMLSAPGAQPQIVRSGETSLEGLVREMLRPMLAQWLDTNLPAMVDRLVAAEIARIVQKKG